MTATGDPSSTQNALLVGVERFEPIEGLRAWLAWAVFLGHIVLFAGLSRVGFPSRLGDIASVSVEVFIIVSGFVITHLLLTGREAYLPYIAKRFFRLFPAFIVCCVVGAATIPISRTPWPGDPTYQYGLQLAALQDTQAQHFVPHTLLHLTMLHGMVSNNVLNYSQWALLPPAWSISLEWQFYLVAPVVLMLFHKAGGPILAVVPAVAGMWLYDRGSLGTFESPSFLPGAAALFLLGIASRFCLDEFRPRAPAVIAIAALAVGCIAKQMAVGTWVAFAIYVFSRKHALGTLDHRFVSIGDVLFTNRLAQWAAKRTYCVYLVHFPVFQLLLTVLTLAGFVSPIRIAAVLLLAGFPLTAIAAEALHRYVELPGMRRGKQVARWLSSESRGPDGIGAAL